MEVKGAAFLSVLSHSGLHRLPFRAAAEATRYLFKMHEGSGEVFAERKGPAG